MSYVWGTGEGGGGGGVCNAKDWTPWTVKSKRMPMQIWSQNLSSRLNILSNHRWALILALILILVLAFGPDLILETVLIDQRSLILMTDWTQY